MVCHAEPAFVQSTQLDLRTGLDNVVYPYGDLFISYLETAGKQGKELRHFGLLNSLAFEYLLEFYLFLFPYDRLCIGGNNFIMGQHCDHDGFV